MNQKSHTTVAHLVMQARAALDADLIADADAAVTIAVTREPANASARLVEAMVRLRQDRAPEAVLAMMCRDDLSPGTSDEPEVAMTRVRALMQAGQTVTAVMLLEELRDRLPDDVRAYRMLAHAYLRAERQDDAIDSLRHVLRLSPSDLASRFMLVDLLAESDPNAAIEYLLDGGSEVADAALSLTLARLYRRAKRFREAEDTYADVVAICGDDADVLMEAAELPVARGEGVQALRWLHRAMLVADDDVPPRTAIATVLLEAGQRESAAWQWYLIARRRPQFAHAWAMVHAIAASFGRTRVMRHANAKLQELLDPEQRHIHLAEAWLQVAGAAVIDDAMAGGQIAEPAASPLTAMLTRARDVFDAHAAIHGSHADVHYHLARCQHALGLNTAARASLERALTINPNYLAANTFRERVAA